MSQATQTKEKTAQVAELRQKFIDDAMNLFRRDISDDEKMSFALQANEDANALEALGAKIPTELEVGKLAAKKYSDTCPRATDCQAWDDEEE